jgi:biopolymer transport protein ExbD
MAINVGGAGGGRRERGLPAMAEINVTPFVDVALVLLIIFMITAHAMDSGIEIDVPKTRSVATATKDLPIVSIKKTGDLFLGNKPVNINDLVGELHTRYPGQTAVYIKADKLTTMEIGVDVMSELGNAKFDIKVVTQFDDSPGRRR